MSTETRTVLMLPASWRAEAKSDAVALAGIYAVEEAWSPSDKPIVPRNPNVAFTRGEERMAHCRSVNVWGFQGATLNCRPLVVACHGSVIVQVKPPWTSLLDFVTLKSGWFEPGTFKVRKASRMSSADDVARSNLTVLPLYARFQAAPG